MYLCFCICIRHVRNKMNNNKSLISNVSVVPYCVWNWWTPRRLCPRRHLTAVWLDDWMRRTRWCIWYSIPYDQCWMDYDQLPISWLSSLLVANVTVATHAWYVSSDQGWGPGWQQRFAPVVQYGCDGQCRKFSQDTVAIVGNGNGNRQWEWDGNENEPLGMGGTGNKNVIPAHL